MDKAGLGGDWSSVPGLEGQVYCVILATTCEENIKTNLFLKLIWRMLRTTSKIVGNDEYMKEEIVHTVPVD